ncbi:MAG: Asp-tRNA(Asn)/Glu-tRNA(Gln) amidotransferase subunit GatC [Nitrospira sp.]|nr:Asp-tRNA(Asn)/Glu-tRNA(Gln) amidotransferase subunit GatC [Candidatus Manganitrophaceae bacterium]HIL34455.1 Asp-tRNA(Asn)/Glu-tRNA(Gln) amidotransferase subunit GatC [Candidatus Manganitrophaceae bacterium]
MKMKEDEVTYVAKLARLALTPEETEQYAGQLSRIFSYIEKLNELDTSRIEPTSHVLSLSNIFREDKVQPSLPTEKVLENAPQRDGSLFQVPDIME